MNKTKYACEFSPDGKHWITQKKVILKNAWNWLTGEDAKKFKLLFNNGKIRIVNTLTDKVIGDN
jgi:hypothetical protein